MYIILITRKRPQFAEMSTNQIHRGLQYSIQEEFFLGLGRVSQYFNLHFVKNSFWSWSPFEFRKQLFLHHTNSNTKNNYRQSFLYIGCFKFRFILINGSFSGKNSMTNLAKFYILGEIFSPKLKDTLCWITRFAGTH